VNKTLIAKVIKATLNTEEELLESLEKMCDIILDDSSSTDEKDASFNTLVECLAPNLGNVEIDFLVV